MAARGEWPPRESPPPGRLQEEARALRPPSTTTRAYRASIRLPAARARPPSPRGASGGRDRGAAEGEGSPRARPAKGPRGAGRRRARQLENSEISANEEKTPRRLGPRGQAKNPPRPRIEDS